MKRGTRLLVTAAIISLLLGGCTGGTQGQTAGQGQTAALGQTAAREETTEQGQTAAQEQTASQGQTTAQEQTTSKEQNTVILYTNDVHCAVDNNIGYDGLEAYKEEMEKEGNDVLLVDDGDAIQGGIYGTLTEGEAIIHLMNDVGYDLAIPGNHEFDYGMEQFLELTKVAEFPYICCNLIDIRTGDTVLEPYRILEAGGRRIAFVGVCTPTTYTSSTPKYFQDKEGNMIYSFMQDSDGSALYRTVQDAVDAANAENPDYTILVAHLGISERDKPYRSTDVIRNTRGIDAVLDGHSHSTVEMEKVKNADGEIVLLTQAGFHLPVLGKVTIDTAGNIKTELVKDYASKAENITADIGTESESFAEKAKEHIADTDFSLRATADDNYTWLVRNNETNLADFVTDAYRFVSGAEIALVNGGGIRDNIDAGEITYSSLVSVHPFSNTLVMRSITGQELADALEFSLSYAPEDFGGFLQVSGVTFDVDLDKNANVQLDDNGMFQSFGSEERRVSNIMVNGEPLDPDRKYTAVSSEYIFLNQGNGYTMFNGEVLEMDREIQDVSALEEYLRSMGGKMPEDYQDPDGQERIRFLSD